VDDRCGERDVSDAAPPLAIGTTIADAASFLASNCSRYDRTTTRFNAKRGTEETAPTLISLRFDALNGEVRARTHGMTSPDGLQAVINAGNEQGRAFEKYRKALEAFSDFLLAKAQDH
jgi:hypothetical protein